MSAEHKARVEHDAKKDVAHIWCCCGWHEIVTRPPMDQTWFAEIQRVWLEHANAFDIISDEERAMLAERVGGVKTWTEAMDLLAAVRNGTIGAQTNDVSTPQ